jgi:hypothetical protein
MANDLPRKLRDRLCQATALVDAALMAAKDLPIEHRVAMQTLLKVAGDRITSARDLADRLDRRAAARIRGPMLAGARIIAER